MKKMILAVISICLIFMMGTAVPTVHAGEKCTIGFYSIQPPFIPISRSMAKLKKFLEKESNGNVEMNLFLGGQLGSESAGLNKVKIGTVQTGNFSAVAISTIEPKANVLLMPFVFNTWDDVEKFAGGPVMEEIGKSLEKKGLKLMGVANFGFYKILSVDKLVASKEDLKGVKIRVYPTPILVDFYKTLGASPTPISFPEVYTALQQGVIDATDCSLDSSYASKQYEVAKYLTMTNHIHGWFVLVANKRWFDKLPEETQKLVSEGFRKYAIDARKSAKEYDEKILKIYKEAGLKIKVLTDEERQAFKDATAPIHKKYKSKIGVDFMEKFYKETNY